MKTTHLKKNREFQLGADIILGHFFGCFLVTTPSLDNVPYSGRYSWHLADFQSVRVGIILSVPLLEKSAFDFLEGIF